MSWFLKRKQKKHAYGWFGNYASWEQAAASSDGYDKLSILTKTKEALLKIKTGEAVYERDSVLFDKKIYPFPLITYLLSDALQKGQALNVLDFGGSLGSTYFQVKDFLTAKLCSSWNVVEQPHYVECGKQNFEDDKLKFFYTIQDCLKQTPVDVLILSSVLPFLPNPHQFLNELVTYGFEKIIIDRTFFINSSNDRLTIQHVWPSVYEASYPAWFLNEAKLLSHFKDNYYVKGEFSSYVSEEAILTIDHMPIGYTKGFCLSKNSNTV